MFFAVELLSCPLLLLLVALVFLFGLSGVFSSFDLVLSGLLRDYAELDFFLLVKRLLAGIFFAEFLVFLPFHLCCAIRCRLISSEGFAVLWTIYVTLLFAGKCLLVLFCCFITVENFWARQLVWFRIYSVLIIDLRSRLLYH